MENMDTIEIAYFNFILIIITIITVIIFGIIVLILLMKDKIHHSFHKGYREGNNDNLKYYKALKEISDSFELFFNDLKDINKSKLYTETLELILKHRETINKYRDK